MIVRMILSGLIILGTWIAVEELRGSLIRKIEHTDSEDNHAIDHVLDNINIQEQYMKNESLNRQNYILSKMETQFSESNKYTL